MKFADIQAKYPDAVKRFEDAVGIEDFDASEIESLYADWEADPQGRTFDDILDNGP